MRICLLVLALTGLAACSSAHKDSTDKAGADAAKQAADKAASTIKKGVPVVPGTVECESKADKRALAVRPKGDGCELGYTKSGQEAVVATSAKGSAHCEATLNKIKTRLLEAGFTCK
ncbi:MAG TPA: hypothetical protein PKC28_08485 [Bdellovibrionales bacterium]|nr:hypothetical protein [Bdellovibrionales bacterium]